MLRLKTFIFLLLMALWPMLSSAQLSDREKGILINLSQTAYLTYFDAFLLALCPLFGALGGMVSRHLTLADIRTKLATSEDPKPDSVDRSPSENQHSQVRTYGPNAALVGGVLGIVVALYFVGAITDHVTSLARVFALCILLGYQAPNLWRAQEKVIASLVDDRLRAILGDKNLIRTVEAAADKPKGADAA